MIFRKHAVLNIADGFISKNVVTFLKDISNTLC